MKRSSDASFNPESSEVDQNVDQLSKWFSIALEQRVDAYVIKTGCVVQFSSWISAFLYMMSTKSLTILSTEIFLAATPGIQQPLLIHIIILTFMFRFTHQGSSILDTEDLSVPREMVDLILIAPAYNRNWVRLFICCFILTALHCLKTTSVQFWFQLHADKIISTARPWLCVM